MPTPDLVTLLRQRIEESLTKRDRSVLAIVGSGVSIQATGKAPAASWGGLLQLGSARCEQVAANWRTRRFDAAGVQVKLASSKVADWVSAATEIEKTLRAAKASVYKDWLRETLGELKPTQPEVLYALGALGVPLATTNYDGLLEHALGLQGATWRTHGLVDQILTGTYPGNAVLHLHGHFSEPESVILGADSYEKILGDKRAQSTLRHLLMSRDLIFVGMGGGLDDPNFGALIDWALDVTLPESRYHFLLLREPETHAYRARIPLTSRIHVVSYGANYPDLVPFLRSLAPGAGGTGAASSGNAGSAAQGNLPSAWVRQSAAAQVPVTRNLVRRAFFDTFLTDALGDAFCEDHFFSTYQQFSAGMEREKKVNVLLSREDPEVVFARLTEYLQPQTPPSSPSELANWLPVKSSSVAPKPALSQQPSTKGAPELVALPSPSLEPTNTSIGLAHRSPALKEGLRPRPQSPLQADVVIITALKLEYDEALKVEAGAVDAWTFSRELLSTDVAFRTFLTSDGRPMRVAMTWTTSMGDGAATDAAVSLLDKLQAGCLAMCGVCAGRRTSAVHPGDVILASLAYRYDTGAVQVEYDKAGQQSRRFQASPGPIPLDHALKARAQVFMPALDASFLNQRPATLAAQCDWILEQLKAGVDPMTHPESEQRCPAWPAAIHRMENLGYVAFSKTGALSLTNKGKAYIGPLLTKGRGSLPVPAEWKFHVAPIATGGNVMRDPRLFEQLSSSMREVLGVDMEVAGIAHTAHKRKLPWVAMKGVMDHADNDKDDLLKEFAAQASAECLLLFLRENPPALHGARAQQDHHYDGKSPKQPPSPTSPAPSGPLRVTPQLEQQKKNALRFIQESPALTKALLENGFGNSTLSGAAFAQAVLDNLLPLSPNEVTEKLAALAAATQLLDPVRELLWRILPLASGWDEVFQEAEATGASRSVLVLPWRTTTLAEIEMARMDGRRVTFEPEGEVPQGILHVPLPTAAYAPLFDSDGARLAEAVLRNLHSEQPPDSSVPNADFWRSIRKAFPSEKEFFEEAKSTLNNEDFGGRRYLLFIDQLLIPHGAEPDAAWTVAQTAIQKVLPGLRLVRLKGQRTEKSKETEILRPIQKIRRLS